MHFACKKFGQALIVIIAQTFEKVNKEDGKTWCFPVCFWALDFFVIPVSEVMNVWKSRLLKKYTGYSPKHFVP